MTNIDNLLKIKRFNNEQQEMIFTIGEGEELPTGLFLAYASRMQDSIARYFYMTGMPTHKAFEKAHEFYQNTAYLETLINHINDSQINLTEEKLKQLRGNILLTSDIEKLKELSVLNKIHIKKQIDEPLSLKVYAQEFCKILVALTPLYNTGYEHTHLLNANEKHYLHFVASPILMDMKNSIEKSAVFLIEDFELFLNIRGFQIKDHAILDKKYLKISGKLSY